MARRSWLIALIVLIAVVLGAGLAWRTGVFEAAPAPSAVGGPFQLTDTSGRTVDQSLLEGKWSAVFFGYTYCPDFCPLTLQTLIDAKTKLGGKGKNLQILFVSVDPARDTPQQVGAYVQNFPGVIGLTGAPAQIDAITRAYKAFHGFSCPKTGAPREAARQAPRDCPDTYLVDHTTAVYLMDPKGRFVNAVTHGLGPDQTADVIGRAMKG